MLGYFIEVTGRCAHPEEAKAQFIHRQTLANAMRFTTTSWLSCRQIANAAGQALAIELGLFETLVKDIVSHAEILALGTL